MSSKVVKKGASAVSKPVALAAVAAVVLVAGVAGYLNILTPGTSSSSTSFATTISSSPSIQASLTSSSSASTAQTAVEKTTSSAASSSSSSSSPDFSTLGTAVSAHLTNLSAMNVPSIMTAYSSSAVVQWEGQTLSPYGMAGTYVGASSIRSLYQATIGQDQQLTLSAGAMNTSALSSGSSVVENVQITGTGASSMLGQFNITVSATMTYQYTGGAWLITHEVWDFTKFHSQSTGGATTFPQWQITGPPLPQRYSESPFKNWVYFYGGAAAAVALAAYLGSIPVIVLIKKKRALSGKA
ncbi:MAG: hypothetical protein OK436_01160 [Thaumarchaeota archaeon]|nr:hypothetical protein [Nitrososphaerota archaeon]